MTHKPSKNHPWRNSPSSSVLKWAREESDIRKVNNYSKGRLEGLSRKYEPKRGTI